MKGFVTFEGCEGVGKSTQIRLLREYLEGEKKDFVLTREPGGSRLAEKIRAVILDAGNAEMCDPCEALLYAAARAQHLHEIIIPALKAGKLVICDRYTDSTYAYQGFAKGLGRAWIDELNRLSVGEYTPELTIFLDLDPTSAFARKGGRDEGDRLEMLGADFHKKVYQGYLLLAERDPERFVRVDASGSKQQTHEKVLVLLRARGLI